METIERLLVQAGRNPLPSHAPDPCPEIERLADFSAGRLSEADAEPIRGHLADCDSCLTVVTMSRQGELEPERLPAVPDRVLERVLGLVGGAPSLWQVAIRFLTAGLELVQQTGTLLTAQPLAVRGLAQEAGSSPEPAEHYTFERAMPPYMAQFSVQRQDRSHVALTLSLEGESGPAPAFQVELWQGNRLRGVRSGVGGTASFSAIQPGEYRLVVLEKGRSAGELYLSLLD